eukprot:TRINITY_DN4470_c0_g1_i1.p1 TRINITY_DN4470_c0_g1~~TRINITY_DN4470_c0_g1_i1.p1  ORF type:complete len:948 (-),score=153.40 TRINITY_DN4470_c0_g1_i1:176-3019(-)
MRTLLRCALVAAVLTATVTAFVTPHRNLAPSLSGGARRVSPAPTLAPTPATTTCMGTTVLGTSGVSCTSACTADGGKICTTGAMDDFNPSLDSGPEMQAVLNALGTNCTSFNFDFGTATDVPNVDASGVCLVTAVNRNSTTFDCTRSEAGKQRLCNCCPAPTSAPTVAPTPAPTTCVGTKVVGAAGVSCVTACNSDGGKLCSVASLNDLNPFVDSTAGMDSAMTALGFNCTSFDLSFGNNTDVPNIDTAGTCLVSQYGRLPSTFDCTRTEVGHQRLCNCCPSPTAAPTPPTFAPTISPSSTPTVAPTTRAPTTAAPTISNGYTLEVRFTFSGVGVIDAEQAEFVTSLRQVLASLTGIAAEFISISIQYTRRTAVVTSLVQSTTETQANAASSSISSAASSGGLNSQLTTQLAASTYPGSLPTGAAVISTTTTANVKPATDDSSGMSGDMFWMIIGIAAAALVMLVIGAFFLVRYLVRRQGSDTHKATPKAAAGPRLFVDTPVIMNPAFFPSPRASLASPEPASGSSSPENSLLTRQDKNTGFLTAALKRSQMGGESPRIVLEVEHFDAIEIPLKSAEVDPPSPVEGTDAEGTDTSSSVIVEELPGYDEQSGYEDYIREVEQFELTVSPEAEEPPRPIASQTALVNVDDAPQPVVNQTAVVYSRQPDQPVCANYRRLGTCHVEDSGGECQWDHPPSASSQVGAATSSSEAAVPQIGRPRRKLASPGLAMEAAERQEQNAVIEAKRAAAELLAARRKGEAAAVEAASQAQLAAVAAVKQAQEDIGIAKRALRASIADHAVKKAEAEAAAAVRKAQVEAGLAIQARAAAQHAAAVMEAADEEASLAISKADNGNVEAAAEAAEMARAAERRAEVAAIAAKQAEEMASRAKRAHAAVVATEEKIQHAGALQASSEFVRSNSKEIDNNAHTLPEEESAPASEDQSSQKPENS